MDRKCGHCEVNKSDRAGQWWSCSRYFGISGYFCPSCYEKISHDAHGQPLHPAEYLMFLMQQT